MQSQESFIQKTFTITDQMTGTVVQAYINVPYLPATRQLNFSRALTQIHTNSVNISNSHIFYLDYSKRMNVYVGQYPFHQQVLLKHEIFLEDSIRINFRKIVSSNSMVQQPCPPQAKKRKVKQRSIREACDAVKQWRQLYQITDQKGKRVYTLQTAAQKVGFAKKTLDDYFNQLRQAQYYGFDFHRHQNDKIGVLRRFVKSCQKKQKDVMFMEDENNDIDKYLKDNNSSDDQDALF